jgi:hypothetical protein
MDYIASLNNPRQLMSDFILFICSEYYSGKGKINKRIAKKEKLGRIVRPDYLEPFFRFLVTQLDQSNEDWKTKDAVLMCLGNLWSEISRHDDLRAMMEPLITRHVLPNLQS